MSGEREESLLAYANQWLSEFEETIVSLNFEYLEALFCEDSHWRDLLALTWHIKTISGVKCIKKALKNYVPLAQPSEFQVDSDRTPPRLVTRAGQQAVEVIFCFKTGVGIGNGVLRLMLNKEQRMPLKAWTLVTALNELDGFEETIGVKRPKGESYSKDFKGPNWLDQRNTAVAYTDREPAVVVIGGGQAGLSIAARLGQMKVDTLIVDREQRIGDNWRKRYHRLTLHNQLHVNHLPYIPFPPSWPTYIPKDKLAGWFEFYAESMELNFWTETEFREASYDEVKKRWSIDLYQGHGQTRNIKPRHIIMATGVSGVPKLPKIPSLKDFDGKVIHSSEYKSSKERPTSLFII